MSELGRVCFQILYRYVLNMPVALDVKNRAAFEYSKRKFVSKYGPDLPVWALLVSGSTGGVRLAFSQSII